MQGPESTSNVTTSSTVTPTKPERNGHGATTEYNGSAPVPAETAVEPEPVAEAPAAKKRMKRSTRRGLTVVVILAVLAALGFGGAYLLYSRGFVSTDNAQVDGDKIEINAPATGTLTNWQGVQGASVSANQVIGRIRVNGPGGPQKPIRAPGNGTIAVNSGVEGQWVSTGTQLATAYDLRGGIYITARVDETDVAGVHQGAPVDVAVDAYSGVPVTGVVTEIQGGAANEFSLFPESNSSGNFQKVTQVIPVKVALTDTGGVQLVPGMNVTVHIHKH
ncbi:MAG TPA: HlyD family efflux transporter periplasmic adaptor subunit [Pseudonocardia sp.]|jgi:multidrug resistance efflux pump|uniref:HlyD family secretion protein n=1 Tax=Pseudonocardia sp. TaxID=60912 RepID=UPI002F42946D